MNMGKHSQSHEREKVVPNRKVNSKRIIIIVLFSLKMKNENNEKREREKKPKCSILNLQAKHSRFKSKNAHTRNHSSTAFIPGSRDSHACCTKVNFSGLIYINFCSCDCERV